MRAPAAQHLADELVVARPVEDRHGHVVGRRLPLALGDPREVVVDRRVEVDDVGRRRPPTAIFSMYTHGPGSNIVPRSATAMTAIASGRPLAVERGAVDGVDGDVDLRRRAVADSLAVVEHRRLVLLALADDDDAVHRRRELSTGRIASTARLVDALLVAAAHQAGPRRSPPPR